MEKSFWKTYHSPFGVSNGRDKPIDILAALCVRRDGVDSLYYVHPDRLGSYTHITNAGKQVVRALPMMRGLPFSASKILERMVWIFFVLLPPFLKYPKY